MVEAVAAGEYTFPEYIEPETIPPTKHVTGSPAPEAQQIAEYLGVAFVPNRLTKRIMGIRDSIQEQQERRAAFKGSFAEQIAKMGRRRHWLRGQPLAVQSWHEKYGNRDPDEVYGRKPVAPKPPSHDIMTGIVHDRDLSDLIQDQQEAKRVNGQAG